MSIEGSIYAKEFWKKSERIREFRQNGEIELSDVDFSRIGPSSQIGTDDEYANIKGAALFRERFLGGRISHLLHSMWIPQKRRGDKVFNLILKLGLAENIQDAEKIAYDMVYGANVYREDGKFFYLSEYLSSKGETKDWIRPDGIIEGGWHTGGTLYFILEEDVNVKIKRK